MMYSKGDTIKFKDGTIALVLKDGIEGPDFVVQYRGQRFTIMSAHQIFDLVKVSNGLAARQSTFYKCESHVWYNILIGDNNMWIKWITLYFKTTGLILPWKWKVNKYV